MQHVQIDPERPEQLALELLGTPTSDVLGLIDSWCADHPGCVSPLGTQETDPLDEEEHTCAAREQRRAFLFIDEEPLPPPHADVWVFGDPVEVRANARAVPRLKVLSEDLVAPAVFPDGSREVLGRQDQLRAATWLVRALRERARIYEHVVRAIVQLRPALAVAHEPRAVAPLDVHELAVASELDVATIRRVAAAFRVRTPVTIVRATLANDRLSFQRA